MGHALHCFQNHQTSETPHVPLSVIPLFHFCSMQTSEPGSCHFLPSGSSTVPPTNLNPGSTKNQFLLCSWTLWRKLTQSCSLASAQSPHCSWWVIFLNPNPECTYTPFKVLPNFWRWLFRPFIVCLSLASIPNISILLSLPALPFSPNDSHSSTQPQSGFFLILSKTPLPTGYHGHPEWQGCFSVFILLLHFICCSIAPSWNSVIP